MECNFVNYTIRWQMSQSTNVIFLHFFNCAKDRHRIDSSHTDERKLLRLTVTHRHTDRHKNRQATGYRRILHIFLKTYAASHVEMYAFICKIVLL